MTRRPVRKPRAAKRNCPCDRPSRPNRTAGLFTVVDARNSRSVGLRSNVFRSREDAAGAAEYLRREEGARGLRVRAMTPTERARIGTRTNSRQIPARRGVRRNMSDSPAIADHNVTFTLTSQSRPWVATHRVIIGGGGWNAMGVADQQGRMHYFEESAWDNSLPAGGVVREGRRYFMPPYSTNKRLLWKWITPRAVKITAL